MRLAPLLGLVLLACGGPVPAEPDGSPPRPPDASRADAGTTADAALRDAATMDAQLADAQVLDATAPAPVRWFEAIDLGWEREPLEDMRTFADRFSGGVCVLDADGRGPVDLFFAARGTGASRLFVGEPALTWVDRTEALGLHLTGDAMGCLAFDADGDGDDDLLVTMVGGVQLFVREPGGFVLRTDRIDHAFEPLGMYASAAAGDVDGDGDLDLLVAGFMRRDPGMDPTSACLARTPCTADINRHEPIANALLLREGDGYVSGNARAPMLDVAEPTLVVAIGDFLEEGRPSLYVGNDLGGRYFDRVLQRQPDGTFVDVALEAGFATNSRGYGVDTMGLASGDLDRDGRLEHATSGFESDATAIFDCIVPAICEDRGTALGMRVTKDTFRWGNAFADLDLDGWPDLIEATGHYHLPIEVEAIGFRGEYTQPPNVLVNLGDGTLLPSRPDPSDAAALAHAGRGIARTDLDDDGRPDVVIATADGAPALLRNVRPRRGRWLALTLEGRAPNTRAVGAYVRVMLGARPLAAEQRAGEGYLGSFDRRMFFGLGPAPDRVDVVVRWPSGNETRVTVPTDRAFVVREP